MKGGRCWVKNPRGAVRGGSSRGGLRWVWSVPPSRNSCGLLGSPATCHTPKPRAFYDDAADCRQRDEVGGGGAGPQVAAGAGPSEE